MDMIERKPGRPEQRAQEPDFSLVGPDGAFTSRTSGFVGAVEIDDA
jgi:hypothetical protein